MDERGQDKTGWGSVMEAKNRREQNRRKQKHDKNHARMGIRTTEWSVTGEGEEGREGEEGEGATIPNIFLTWSIRNHYRP